MPQETYPDYPDPRFTKPDPKRRYLCRHIHASGKRCGSPAVRGRNFCFYHGTARQGFPASYGRAGDPRSYHFTFQHIDTRADIQLALFDVLQRVAANDLDTKRAGLLLYGLQIASSNLPRPRHEDAPAQPIEHVDHSYALGDIAPVHELPELEPTTDGCPTFGEADRGLTAVTPADLGVLPTEPTPEPVILSEARSAQSKDPRRARTHHNPQHRSATERGPIRARTHPRTTTHKQPATCHLQLPTSPHPVRQRRPRTSPPKTRQT